MAWSAGLTSELYTETLTLTRTQEEEASQVEGGETGHFLARVDWKFLDERDPVFRRHITVVVAGPSMWILGVVSQVT